jgi:hypothetical protein
MPSPLLSSGVTLRRRNHTRKKRNDPIASHSISSKRTASYSGNQNSLLSAFKNAVRNSLEEHDPFLQKNSTLAACVVEASLAFPHPPNASLLLEEHAVELLSMARLLVKNASASKDPSSILDCLLVSIHEIRALVTVVVSGKRRDTAIKLLYHAVVLSEATFSRSNNSVVMERAACYCFSACEALSVFLRNYSISMPSTAIASFSNARENYLFPIPILSNSKEEVSASIPIENVLTIGSDSILALAKVLASPLWSNNDFNPPPNKSELQAALMQYSFQLPQDESLFELVASQIIHTVCMPWLSCLAMTSSAREATSLCKRASRVLWDAAGCLSSKNANLWLSVRGDAVVALLPFGENVQWGDDSALEQVRASTFDIACTSAWKAAASFFQNIPNSAPKSGDTCLRQFHERVGAVIDASTGKPSTSYFEYCAYRAFHCGSTLDIPFKSDNFLFHGSPSSCSNINCDDEAGWIGKVSLTLFFLALNVRNQLKGGDCDRDLLASGESVVKYFEEALTERDNSAVTESLFLWYKHFSGLSLHLAVCQVLADSSTQRISIDEFALGMAAKLLSRCFGPLFLRLVRSGLFADDKSRCAWDQITECFMRGSIAFDTLSRTSSKKQYRNLANSALVEIATTLVSKRVNPPQSCMTKAAKVGHRTVYSSVLPLSCSLLRL